MKETKSKLKFLENGNRNWSPPKEHKTNESKYFTAILHLSGAQCNSQWELRYLQPQWSWFKFYKVEVVQSWEWSVSSCAVVNITKQTKIIPPELAWLAWWPELVTPAACSLAPPDPDTEDLLCPPATPDFTLPPAYPGFHLFTANWWPADTEITLK